VAKLPEPPAPEVLAALGPDVHVLRSGTRVWRIYFQAGAHPTTWAQLRSWGPSDARFDHHVPPPSVQARRILYGAVGPKAALSTIAEVFQATRVVERGRRSPAVVAFETEEKLRLLDLTGTWPTRAGASMALSSGRRDRARDWSRAIYAAFPDVDGILYASSMNANEPCVALYERATRAMPRHPVFHRLLSDPAIFRMLKNACATCGYLLV
jgi:hypothetical protein